MGEDGNLRASVPSSVTWGYNLMAFLMINLIFFSILLIYLVAPRLSCGRQDLSLVTRRI